MIISKHNLAAYPKQGLGRRAFGLSLAAALAFGLCVSGPTRAQPQADNSPAWNETSHGWRWHVESIASAVNDGFQLALDPHAGLVYVVDAAWRAEERDPEGRVWVVRTASGKLVVFNSSDRSLVGVHSYLDLTRSDGSGTERVPLDWASVTDPAVSQQTSMRTTFSPYGVAIDSQTFASDGKPDATIVTTAVRGRDPAYGHGGHLVIYRASQGAPTDADRVWQLPDGSPAFAGMRRVVVNSRTHKAYVTNMGGSSLPGYIAVVDLPSKTVEARVPLPAEGGVIGVTIDEDHNLVYVGSLRTPKLHVFDADAVNTSDATSLTLNADLMRTLDQDVGSNARPEYDPVTKRVYVASFGSPSGRISAIDANPASASYGEVLASVEAGQTNALTIDGQRGLVFSANLGDREVAVHDANSLALLLRIPTSGQPVNTAIDPQTGDVWVANRGDAGKVDVIRLRAPSK
ncbi:hypothetical protein L6Q21_10895 [Sandaracinobacter sp. RS1-74]|uniref:YncE family protein n=1 Tax=Sandaracinobacteroides sayramensis TaxID=2913411 RepID=UPI001EDB3729|nr:hypothetical protein [Sandaracinobacteroides sayramensis]MCG2841487.1 hypothetical protein [Sandaracinobacteroides sayramensis]